MRKLNYRAAINHLSYRRDELSTQLKELSAPDQPLIDEKVQIDLAIKALEFCDNFKIRPSSKIIELPDPGCGYAGYSIVQLDEDGSILGLVFHNGEKIEFFSNTILIERDIRDIF